MIHLLLKKVGRALRTTTLEKPKQESGADRENRLNVLAVQFMRIHPRSLEMVPLDEAWERFEQSEGTHSIRGALIENPEGTVYYTYAKSWTTWDFKRRSWRLVRIGLGAGGDCGPEHPDAEVHQRRRAVLVEGDTGPPHWI